MIGRQREIEEPFRPRFLGTGNADHTRRELVEGLDVSDGGRLSQSLNALISSDFVAKYVPFGPVARGERYKLVDPFCQFRLHFLDRRRATDEQHWQHRASSQEVVAWRGTRSRTSASTTWRGSRQPSAS